MKKFVALSREVIIMGEASSMFIEERGEWVRWKSKDDCSQSVSNCSQSISLQLHQQAHNLRHQGRRSQLCSYIHPLGDFQSCKNLNHFQFVTQLGRSGCVAIETCKRERGRQAFFIIRAHCWHTWTATITFPSHLILTCYVVSLGPLMCI